MAGQGVSIVQANQYEDLGSQMFFMRYVVDASRFAGTAEDFASGFRAIADELEMDWRVVDASVKQRVAILASKFDHCLAYLLHRCKVGDLPCEIPCVISNHETLRDLVEWHGIPFHYVAIPRDAGQKRAAFEKIAQLIGDSRAETIVLARYMQIFPSWLCEQYRHQVINIHHSFLPSFAGAKPYHQAEERGVKLIGATCHYVTEKLDEGPIIEQDVIRIRHSDSIDDMMRYGKDVENTVLARGLRYHLEDRILVDGNKTILFN
jgi:formyltetrahydrofolate deformylase